MRAVLAVALLTGVAAAERAAPNAGAPASDMPAQHVMRPPRRPPPKPQPPPAPAEVSDLAKTRAGTWTCKGNIANGDGSSQPLQGTLVAKLDLDNAWLQLAFTSPALKVTIYRGYDAVAKQWTQVELQSGSGHVLSTSPGEENGEWTWTGATESPNGTTQVKDHERLDGGKLELRGEALLGGSWEKTYNVTCAK